MASSSNGVVMAVAVAMAASSGSGSEEEEQLQLLMMIDQRKRKRMISNRESARRSRMRKQKHLDDLTAQLARTRKENNQMIAAISSTTQLYINVETDNSILRAQMAELTQRLDSLNEIITLLNSTTTGSFGSKDQYSAAAAESRDCFNNNNSWDYLFMMNQPIIAPPDLLQY
ncbi:bZIP transcription factor 11-like [Impatiens glandulifera]|uniref:bZIP transcription factor 11-like n=1 Tax=Impatiens glandulifera TaxID=253017 RepID=UPI001FB06E34|nr:bZIP transcription factor 11-like [Impatiens glandulifera]